MTASSPLILAAALDEAAQDWFEALRRTHYPVDRNRVPAHLTLFHSLPGKQERAIAEALKAACRGQAPMRLEVRGPWFLGQGVAYRIASPELQAFRAGLAEVFAPWLRSQDQAPFRPHVTIQNKADPDEARRLLEELHHAFEPFDILAEGVDAWRYCDGPWELAGRVRFEG
jgi:2'-5' RNA ligase